MSKTRISDLIAIVLLIVLGLPVVYFSLFVPFETDTGDSVMHYFFARYAFHDFNLLLDHWAKPFFTLLASPFAQFGFGGIKLFNGIVGLISAYLAYGIAKKLELRFAWLAIIFVMFAPDYFVKIFSGYTEPLFGLVLIASVYLVMIKKPIAAALLISFLPFVRSEGLIIIMVFAFYFLLKKNYKSILLLSAGHIFYSIVGFLAGKSLLWVFTEIPYHVVSVYGKGDFAHFPVHLLLTLGVPLFTLSIIGILTLLVVPFFKTKPTLTNSYIEVLILLLGSFMAYFLFHAISWRYGLFGSMGIGRVLIAMVPVLAVVSLIGLNFITNWRHHSAFPHHAIVYLPIIGFILVFPFLHNPASIDWKKEFHRTDDMMLMHKIARDISKSYPDKFLYYSNPYMGFALDINPFDRSKHLSLTDMKSTAKVHPNSLIIWDSWFSIIEEGTDSTVMLNTPSLRLLKRYNNDDKSKGSSFLILSN